MSALGAAARGIASFFLKNVSLAIGALQQWARKMQAAALAGSIYGGTPWVPKLDIKGETPRSSLNWLYLAITKTSLLKVLFGELGFSPTCWNLQSLIRGRLKHFSFLEACFWRSFCIVWMLFFSVGGLDLFFLSFLCLAVMHPRYLD
jgi:hypothetical protein